MKLLMTNLRQKNETSQSKIPNIVLNDGNIIPCIGLGCWIKKRPLRHWADLDLEDLSIKFQKIEKSESIKLQNAIEIAIKYGYTHFDTAQVYHTEYDIGNVLERLNIDRKDIFITTKTHSLIYNKQTFDKWFNHSLQKLKTDYIDLLLIHSPTLHNDTKKPIRNDEKEMKDNNDDLNGEKWNISSLKGSQIIETYKQMIKYQQKGLIKSIGVSNFGIQHLKLMIEDLRLPIPAINQIEISPFIQENELFEYCKKYNIKLTAFSPLCSGKEFGKKNEILNRIAKKYDKSFAQIMLKWSLQKEFIVIPHSMHEHEIKENCSMFEFQLKENEMEEIDGLNMENGKGRTAWNLTLDDKWDLDQLKKLYCSI